MQQTINYSSVKGSSHRLVSFIILFIGILTFSASMGEYHNLQLKVFLFITSLFLTGFGFKKLKQQSTTNKKQIQQFIADNNWTSGENSQSPVYDHPQFSRGVGNVSCLITGQINTYSFWMNKVSYNTLKKKLKITVEYEYEEESKTLYELVIKLPVVLPKFYIHYHEYGPGKGVGLRKQIQDLDILNLEGDFNDYFDVYIEPGKQDEVLSILTPDVMAALVDSYNITCDTRVDDFLTNSSDDLNRCIFFSGTYCVIANTNLVLQPCFQVASLLTKELKEKYIFGVATE